MMDINLYKSVLVLGARAGVNIARVYDDASTASTCKLPGFLHAHKKVCASTRAVELAGFEMVMTHRRN